MNRCVGSVLIITAESLGIGIIAMPAVTARMGFLSATITLVIIWFFMLIGAFFLLEANLWFQENSNYISMSKNLLGKDGKYATWILYVITMYAALCAEAAAGGTLVNTFLAKIHLALHPALSSLIFILLLGSITWLGTNWTDYTNRALMLIKFSLLFILVASILPYTHHTHYLPANPYHLLHDLPGVIMIMVLAFTFSIVLPAIRVYLRGDVKQLKWTIFVGMTIPLFIYIIWIYVIQSTLPLYGTQGLSELAQKSTVVEPLIIMLSTATHSHLLAIMIHTFISVCILTIFLIDTLALYSFLDDAINYKKNNRRKKGILYLLMFAPIIIILIINHDIFIEILKFSGILCTMLVIVLPTLMVYCGRYRQKIAKAHAFQVYGGKPLLIIELSVGILFITLAILKFFL